EPGAVASKLMLPFLVKYFCAAADELMPISSKDRVMNLFMLKGLTLNKWCYIFLLLGRITTIQQQIRTESHIIGCISNTYTTQGCGCTADKFGRAVSE
ncbi:MAG: hypothetical protein RL447_982, partial [Bacteroidota bacterium]